MNVADRPRFSLNEASSFAQREYGVSGELSELPSERDQNFRIKSSAGESWVLKVAHPDEERETLELQNSALLHLSGGTTQELYPTVEPSLAGALIAEWTHGDRRYLVRLVTYLAGIPIATVTTPSDSLLRDVGERLGELNRSLWSFAHPAMHRELAWDSKLAFRNVPLLLGDIDDLARRELAARSVQASEDRLVPLLSRLPMQVIHNDVNDHNLLVGDGGRVSGIIDFGDMVHSYRLCELANALAYLLLEKDDGARIAAEVVRGFQSRAPLQPEELLALPDFIRLRLCLSVSMSARQRTADAGNAYLSISEAPAWRLLERLEDEDGERLAEAVHGQRTQPRRSRSPEDIMIAGAELLSRTLSTSYAVPLKIVRGAGQYLFDAEGRRSLDCVNNVCHVGHCHPRVVAAGAEQMGRLNTNTRFLHDHLVEYAQRLTALLPDPLKVCFFVNSGSEANELALRLARTHTNAVDMIVIDQSYHGHTQSLINVSPYKYDGKGGSGQPSTTHKVPVPDRYRGPYGPDDRDAGRKYAAAIGDAVASIERAGRAPAGFIAESILGVAGQIELPPGYLTEAYEIVRRARGVCIADEVQVGFGRVGEHQWAFETHGVVPDIVTMGKPMGNGHPMAAVVTTPAVARSFETGMEYFNTFGGNPVSCAIGLAVLDVLESERRREHAQEVGAYFLDGLRELAQRQ
ncbi:MAG: 4-aminobutyrate aminotransferase-like enzyme/Ser/Thr protein kinase RdoA (MazF antagonist), partial [Myxococcota bacterium]